MQMCQRRVCSAYNDGDQRRVCSAYIDGEDVGITDVESFDLEPFAQVGCLIHCPQRRCFIGVDAFTQVTPETLLSGTFSLSLKTNKSKKPKPINNTNT